MSISLEDIIRAALEEQEERRTDPTLVDHLYLDKKWSIAQIARHTGLHRATVYRRLEASGAYRGPGKPGPPRKAECSRGHDLEEWGIELGKAHGGGRDCRLCKRQRDRETYHRMMARKREAEG